MTDPTYSIRVAARSMPRDRAAVEVSRYVHAAAYAVRTGRLDKAERLLDEARAVVLGQADKAGEP